MNQKGRFRRWLDNFENKELASKFGIHPSTVGKWRIGHVPRPKQMRAIRRLTSGYISYDHMIDGD
jgi:hypothetical protein